MRIISAIILIYIFIPISGISISDIVDIDEPEYFRINDIRFQLNPVVNISNYPESGEYQPQLLFSNISVINDTLHVIYEYADMRLTLKVSGYSYMDDAVLFSYSLAGRQELKLKDFYLDFSLENFSNALYGPEAIYYNDSSLNLPTVPFKDRVAEYQSSNGSVYIVGSKFPGTSNVEVIKNNSIYFYDSEFHKAFWRKHNKWLNWRQISQDKKLHGAIIISDREPKYPLFNYFPSGKRAAFTLSSDADYETVNRLKTAFFGSNIESHPDYGVKGLASNNLCITNSIFGYHWERDAEIHQEIIAAGNRIAYHTFFAMKDEREDLRNNLMNEVPELSINYWIDHNSGVNPEDLAANGAVPGSENYILDILEEAGFKYAWITDGMNYTRNAFDEYFQLPHHCEAMTKDYKLYILGRRSGINWEWQTGESHLGFKPNVTDSTITDLIEHRGLMHMYTHLCMPDTDGSLGFLNWINAEQRYEVKEDAEACFRMLSYHQSNSGLWVAPAEEIYDRMFIVDSLQVNFIRNLSDRTIYDIHNPTNVDLYDMEINYKEDILVFNLPAGGTKSLTIFHLNNLDEADSDSADHEVLTNTNEDESNYSETLELESKIMNGSLVVRVMLSMKNQSGDISIYNIKGQKVTSGKLSPGVNTYKFPISSFSSGVYLLKCSSGKQSIVRKTIILK